MVEALKNQKLRRAVKRLADDLPVEDRRQGGDGPIQLPLVKRTIASLLGLAPENLSRACTTLRAYGVTVRGAGVMPACRDAPTRLARPEPLSDGREPDLMTLTPEETDV